MTKESAKDIKDTIMLDVQGRVGVFKLDNWVERTTHGVVNPYGPKDVPVKTFAPYWQQFSMTADGTLSVQKLGHIVERDTNSIIRLNGTIQRGADLWPR